MRNDDADDWEASTCTLAQKPRANSLMIEDDGELRVIIGQE
jgi:hypothetical protein